MGLHSVQSLTALFVLVQDTLTHSLLICEVSSELLASLEEDKKVMKEIPAIRFDGDLFENVSLDFFVNSTQVFTLMSLTNSVSLMQYLSMLNAVRPATSPCLSCD